MRVLQMGCASDVSFAANKLGASATVSAPMPKSMLASKSPNRMRLSMLSTARLTLRSALAPPYWRDQTGWPVGARRATNASVLPPDTSAPPPKSSDPARRYATNDEALVRENADTGRVVFGRVAERPLPQHRAPRRSRPRAAAPSVPSARAAVSSPTGAGPEVTPAREELAAISRRARRGGARDEPEHEHEHEEGCGVR